MSYQNGRLEKKQDYSKGCLTLGAIPPVRPEAYEVTLRGGRKKLKLRASSDFLFKSDAEEYRVAKMAAREQGKAFWLAVTHTNHAGPNRRERRAQHTRMARQMVKEVKNKYGSIISWKEARKQLQWELNKERNRRESIDAKLSNPVGNQG